MATSRFKIVYCGKLKPGVRAQQAIAGFVSRFEVSETQARNLILGGREAVLKKDVDAETAETFRITLEAVGLEVRVDPMTAPPPKELELTPIEPAGRAVAYDADFGAGATLGFEKPDARMAGGDSAAGPAPSPPPSAAAAPPHEPPGPAATAGPAPGQVSGPHARGFGAGWSWIAKGFWHFQTDPWPWIGAIVILYVLTIAIGLIPVVGAIATTLLGPIFTGGLMIGAQAQDRGEDFRVEHLFGGFSNQPGQLALIGVIYLVGGLLIALFVGVWVGGSVALTASAMNGATLGTPDAGQLLPLIAPTILLPALLALLLAIPLAMALYLAPPLVAIDGLTAAAAMKLSFVGCLKNILPFLLYGLVAVLLLLLGSLPFLLGLLVVLPLLMASIYAAYRDIFFEAQGS